MYIIILMRVGQGGGAGEGGRKGVRERVREGEGKNLVERVRNVDVGGRGDVKWNFIE